MLYDERRAAMVSKSGELKRNVQDLLYDIESYMIDCLYGNDKTVLDGESSKTKLGRAKCKEKTLDKKQKNDIINCVINDLEQLGVPQKIKGVRIISECIVLAVKETLNNRPYYLMKMYPEVAETFGVTVNNAEKLCRYACRYIDINSNSSIDLKLFKNQNSHEYKDLSLKELVDALTLHAIDKCNLKISSR